MKKIFITGATSGIGMAAACKLAANGNRIIATVKNAENGNLLQSHYKSHFPQGQGSIEIIQCNLSSFESIVDACDQVKANHTFIDVLINNAGIWNFSYRESKSKIEETFHVNVLAPLLINHLLLGLLLKSKEPKSIFAA